MPRGRIHGRLWHTVACAEQDGHLRVSLGAWCGTEGRRIQTSPYPTEVTCKLCTEYGSDQRHRPPWRAGQVIAIREWQAEMFMVVGKPRPLPR